MKTLLTILFALLLPALAGADSTSVFVPPASTNQTTMKTPFSAPAYNVVRDAGIGLGLGAFAGMSFVLMSQGRFPSENRGLENEALMSGMLAGLLGGAVMGIVENKRNSSPAVSLQPATSRSPWSLVVRAGF